jgi:hypothetical protein
MDGEVLLLQPYRSEIGERRHPGAADFQRLCLCGQVPDAKAPDAKATDAQGEKHNES